MAEECVIVKNRDSIMSVCLWADTKNPVKVLEQLMSLPFCHMHGPEHHVLVGASLLTAYKNAGGEVELESALIELMNRGKTHGKLGVGGSDRTERYRVSGHCGKNTEKSTGTERRKFIDIEK